MESVIANYLMTHLAPKISSRFNIDELLVKEEFRQFFEQSIIRRYKTLSDVKRLKLSRQDKKSNVSQKDKLRVFNERWTLGKKIGFGGFGTVYEAYDVNGDTYAMKIVDRLQNNSLKKEVSIYAALQDEFCRVPKLIDHGNEKDLTFLVIPLYEYSLSDRLKQGVMSMPEIICVMTQVVATLQFIHTLGYAHLDIKPGNIMYSRGNWYLIDYGLSIYFIGCETTPFAHLTRRGTLEYMATDIHYGIPSRKADLESLAYTMLKMCNYTLSWTSINFNQATDDDIQQLILAKKQMFENCHLLDIPLMCRNYLTNLSRLSTGQTPNYEMIFM